MHAWHGAARQCMNDDAVPIYYAMIDQMTLGTQTLSTASRTRPIRYNRHAVNLDIVFAQRFLRSPQATNFCRASLATSTCAVS